MTNEQAKKIKQLIKERRRMEEPVAILDLIIEIFQLANELFRLEMACVTGIEWRITIPIFPSDKPCWEVGFIKNGKWTKEPEVAETRVMITQLFNMLNQLKYVRQEALDKVLADCKNQLCDCGLKVEMEKNKKGIYIA